jgi:excisionase family DNA binding protein
VFGGGVHRSGPVVHLLPTAVVRAHCGSARNSLDLRGDALTDEPRTYTTAEVAEILHMNRATVRHLINSGRLGHLDISPRQFLVGHDQLMAFIDAHRRNGDQ